MVKQSGHLLENILGGTVEKGLFCQGTTDELEQWKQYKKEKALRFVEQGYSVAWNMDASNSMHIFIPHLGYGQPIEIRADVKFFGEPSMYGINNGKISKLCIQTKSENLTAKIKGQPYETIDTLFSYDRSRGVDRLMENRRAKQLYDVVIKELN